jgi:iodotyrosine deiodinase
MSKRKLIAGYPFIAHTSKLIDPEESLRRSHEYREWFETRRSIRDFSNRPVSAEIIANLVAIASLAPSGANKQPWTFCIVSDPELKKKIRVEAEKEEYASYHGRMSAEWIEDLMPLQTDWTKPFLEIASYLIVVFKKPYDINPDGSKRTNYYVAESVGIACGFLLAAVHNSGLCALTHTPSPMNFLSKILNRPENERPYLLIPIGYPAEETFVPEIKKKKLADVMVHY